MSRARTSSVAVASILLVALALRVAAVLLIEVDPRARWSFDMSWYDGVARRLLAGFGYVGVDWAPTAQWPPGYPLLLSAVYRLLGPSLMAAKLANALLGTATVFLAYRIACEIVRPGVGLVAAAIMALFPGDVLFSPPILSEPLFAALFCAVLWIFLRWTNRGVSSLSAWFAFGLLLGVATLVRGIALVVLPIFSLAWLAGGTSLRRTLGYSGVAAAGLVIALLPWTVRNHLQLGYPIPVASSGAAALWLGQYPITTTDQMLPPKPSLPETQSGPDLQVENPQAEVAIARGRTREALAWMTSHPGKIAAAVPAKIHELYKNDRGAYPWIEPGLRKRLSPARRPWFDALVDGYYFAVLALALVGTRHFLTRDRGAVLLPIVVGWFTLVHGVLFFGSARFHHPLLPVLAVMAATELAAATRRKTHASPLPQ